MRNLVVILAALVVLSVPVISAAQPADAPAAATAQPDGPYQSPMRAQCEAELEKDAKWRAELRESLRPAVHAEDAALMMTNKRHVVMAYAAMWGLVVIFVVLLWLRQQKLVAEIARLEEDLEKAASED